MKISIQKTVVIELTENEAFAVKTYLEIAEKELSKVPDAYAKKANLLIGRLEERGI